MVIAPGDFGITLADLVRSAFSDCFLTEELKERQQMVRVIFDRGQVAVLPVPSDAMIV